MAWSQECIHIAGRGATRSGFSLFVQVPESDRRPAVPTVSWAALPHVAGADRGRFGQAPGGAERGASFAPRCSTRDGR